MSKKEKPRCKNCGDETTFPSNSNGERAQKGWCVPCYTQWFKFAPHHTAKAWSEPRGLYGRTPYSSRPLESSYE